MSEQDQPKKLKKKKPILRSIVGKATGASLGAGTGAVVGTAVGGPMGTVAGAAAGAAVDQSIQEMISAITGAQRNDPQFKEFAKHLEEYLRNRPERIEGISELVDTTPKNRREFKKAYTNLYSHIDEFDNEIQREVLMRGLARCAVVDVGEDVDHLPNSDTLISIIRQVKNMTPRQLAIVSLIAEKDTEPNEYAPGSWWVKAEGQEQNNINQRRMYQEIHELTQGSYKLIKHRPKLVFGKEPIERIPSDWNEVNPRLLTLSRQGEDFCKVLHMEAFNPAYRLAVLNQFLPTQSLVQDAGIDADQLAFIDADGNLVTPENEIFKVSAELKLEQHKHTSDDQIDMGL